MKLLVGDIGGTNTRLARFDGSSLHDIAEYRNAELSHLSEAIEDYLARHGTFDVGCFGVAGPVVDQGVQMTNLGWRIEGRALETAFGFPVRIVNDFHAQAFAAPHLRSDQVVELGAVPEREPGHLAVIGAGTGLGEAQCIWNGETWLPVAGEGGHCRFGPKSAQEIELLTKLMDRWPDHVSVERVVSGPGILNVYDALRGDTPRHDALSTGDPSAAITRLALDEACPLAVKTLNIFVDVLADEAASLALKCNAHKVIVSGGIPPKIMPILKQRFRASFEEKGRYRSLMEGIPVWVVTESNFGLLGAGYAALDLTRALTPS